MCISCPSHHRRHLLGPWLSQYHFRNSVIMRDGSAGGWLWLLPGPCQRGPGGCFRHGVRCRPAPAPASRGGGSQSCCEAAAECTGGYKVAMGRERSAVCAQGVCASSDSVFVVLTEPDAAIHCRTLLPPSRLSNFRNSFGSLPAWGCPQVPPAQVGPACRRRRFCGVRALMHPWQQLHSA